MKPLKRIAGLKSPSPTWFSQNTHYEYGSANSNNASVCAESGCAHAGSIELTYLGTAGFVIKGAGRTIVLDPYLTRTPLPTLVTSPLRPNAELIQRIIPVADDVLVGHAHYDHILDAPILCQQTGARLIGSPSTLMAGRAAGLPEHQMLSTLGNETIPCGQWQVRGLASRHGKILGRIPLPGNIDRPPQWPPRMRELRHGPVLNWWLEAPGLRIVHIDSADFIPESLATLHADIVCLCAVGRSYRPRYVQEVVELLKPRWIVPCHWDTMMTPLEEPAQMIPWIDIPGLLSEIRTAGVTPIMVPLLGKVSFGSAGISGKV
ncbi:Hypothetical protein HDN1F_33390 [gamma proteobacterium HdN1]|nr:Hypothetical protein HDN1F_33390 [gamma proteobacterium HdN1]